MNGLDQQDSGGEFSVLPTTALISTPSLEQDGRPSQVRRGYVADRAYVATTKSSPFPLLFQTWSLLMRRANY